MKVKLGDLTKIRTGKLDANAASENGKYPFFTCSKEPLRISTYSYDCECVLVAGNGDLNAKYYNGKFDAYQRTYIIESNSDRRLYLPYLYYFMTRYIQDLRRLSIGGVIKYIKLGNLTDAEISLPDIEKQKVACKKLEKVKNIIDKKESQLFYLDNLIKARFVEMFGNSKSYPIKSLSDIAKYWNGLTYKPTDVSSIGTIVLRSSNIQNMQLTLNDIVRVKCDIGDKKLVKKNDILMCSRNGSANLVGKVALIPNLKEQISFGAFMMIIRSDYYSYLMTYFQLPEFRSQISTGTTTINQITRYMLDKIKLPVPDRASVNEFATFVAQVDKSKFALQNNIKSLMNLWYNIN